MITANRLLCLACLCTILAGALSGAEAGSLRVGASKADITPPERLLPFPQSGPGRTPFGRPFVAVHDRLWARAIVVDDGTNAAALVSLDLVKVPHPDELLGRIVAATGISPAHIVLAATHTHNEPFTSPAGGESNAGWIPYFDAVAEGTVQAVRKAQAALRPGRIGFGAGRAFVNVNNGEYAGRTNAYDPAGPSDKTLSVVKFETLTGEPVAVFLNYAVHAEVLFRAMTRPDGYEISGDIAGATSALVEAHYANRVVTLWTSGAAGDQEPEYRALYATPDGAGPVDQGAGAWTLLDVQARRLAEEAIRVADGITPVEALSTIRGAVGVVTCPGQRASGASGSTDYRVQETAPVSIGLGLLTINDVAFVSVGAEVSTRIGEQLRRAVPSDKTIAVTLAGGNIGYILDDASYQRFSHGVGASPLKPGCAESGLVRSVTDSCATAVVGAMTWEEQAR